LQTCTGAAQSDSGEHAGHAGARRQLDQREILAIELADGGFGDTETDTGDGQQGSRLGRESRTGMNDSRNRRRMAEGE
jgi:hypothetical protein